MTPRIAVTNTSAKTVVTWPRWVLNKRQTRAQRKSESMSR